MKINLVKCFYAYWYLTMPVGAFICGREQTVPRDKSKDYQLCIKYFLMSPVFVPIYIYKNGLPKFASDSRWDDDED